MRKLITFIFLVFSLVVFKEISAEGMTLKKQGAGSPPNNQVLTAEDFIPFANLSSSLNTGASLAISSCGSYSCSVSGPCSLTGSQLTLGSSPGTCTITARYGNLSKTFAIAVIAPQNISVSASPSTINTSGTTTLSTTGNQGTVTYSVSSGSCTVSGNTVTAGSSGGTCTITATAAAVSGYAVGTATTTITVNAILNQTITVTSNISTMYKRSGCNSVETATLTTTGNQCATPSVVYTTTGAGCSINGNLLSATTSSTSCTVTATQAACSGANNQNYAAATSSALSIPVSWTGFTQETIAASTISGTAASPARSKAAAASTTVTLQNGLRPYRISCSTPDYKANCSILANDGTETVGAGCAACSKASPQIYGGMNPTFTVKAWVVIPSLTSGFAAFQIQDSCSNGTPYSKTVTVNVQ